jgi:hemerythrin-like domain-containing protein
VTFLADHIDFGISMLHHHHSSEDEFLFHLLVERYASTLRTGT